MAIQTVVNILLDVQLVLAAMGALAVVTLAVWDSYVHLERHWAARARRWFDVYKYAAIAFGVVVLAGPWLAGNLTAWFRDGTLPANGSIALLVAIAALFLAALRARPTTVGKLRYALLFPPWWVAALLAQLFAWGYWQAFPASWQAMMPGDNGSGLTLVMLSTFTGTCTLVGGLLLWDKWRALDGKVSKASKRSDWLRDDNPIETAAEDKFGHTAIAKRIADRLSSDKGASAIAVIGGFGSGKSSVRNLTIEALNNNPSIIIVPVSAWPYESASALVTGILERVVGELADRAGWEALRHVPARYREAVEGSAGGWGKLLRLLERPRMPEDVLREIDDTALALTVRVVVWVEDLERYAPVPDDEPDTPEMREKLEPVRALLHQLQELQNVTIVVATTKLGLGFDLEKLARFIEIMPRLSRDLVLQRLQEARMEAMRAEYVDSVPSMVRMELTLKPNRWDVSPIVWGVLHARRLEHATWKAALVALAPSPRVIKQGLRDFLELWEALRGEVDIDHALAASLLRHSEPQVFQKLVSHAVLLRPSNMSELNCEESIKNAGAGAERVQAVATLLEHLFASKSEQHPQGFGKSEPADYWARFLARSVEKAHSDQPILRAISLFATDGSGNLLELSFHEKNGLKIRAFALLLPTRRVFDLLDAQLRRVQRKGLSWPHRGDPPAVNDTLLICIERAGWQSEWPSEELLRMIDEHVRASVASRNLRLADWLIYWFGSYDASPTGRVPELLAAEHRRRLRRKFLAVFRELWRRSSDAVAVALAWISLHSRALAGAA